LEAYTRIYSNLSLAPPTELAVAVFEFRLSASILAIAAIPAAARRRAPLPGRLLAWLAIGSAANSPDQRDPRVKPTHNGQVVALLLKRPPISLILHAGPSTSINSYISVLNFMF
jgi:hypothetical protein